MQIMARRSCRFVLLALLSVGCRTQAPGPASESRPKLLVLVVFDQMRADYISRWSAYFGDDGIKRLMNDGTSFTNCHIPYACTETGPGHASILTGCSPDWHGIIANDWF